MDRLTSRWTAVLAATAVTFLLLPARSSRAADAGGPWRAVMSFVNWPIGVEPKNPQGILPQAIEDRVHGYYCFRNGWKNGEDIVVTALLGWGPKDAYKPAFGPIVVWGLGKRWEFGSFTAPGPGQFVALPDGSGSISAGGKFMAVDFSVASGAPLLLAGIGIGQGKSSGFASFSSVTANDQAFTILTLSKDKHPEAKAEGNKVHVGGQTLSFDGKGIVIGK